MRVASVDAVGDLAGSERSLDATFLRWIIVGLLVSCSISRLPMVIGASSMHHSLIYWDFPFVLVLAGAGALAIPLFGRFHAGIFWAFLPLNMLAVWCFSSGMMFSRQPDFFAASILQYANAALLAVFAPTVILRYRLAAFSMDVFLVLSLAVSAVAFTQAAIAPGEIFLNVTSTLNPNRSHIGVYMITALAVGLYRSGEVGGNWRNVAAFSAFTTILISGSRAALIGAAPILVIHFFRRTSLANVFKMLAGVLLIFWILAYIGGERQKTPFEKQGRGHEHRETFEVAEGVEIDKSAGRRLLMWAATWEAINASPDRFWMGYGFTNYRWEFGRAVKLFFYTNAAHNVFLHMWMETGLIGLLLYLGVFGSLVFFSILKGRRHPPVLLLGGLAIGLLLTGFTQETFYPNEAVSNFPVLFVFLAVVMAVGAVQKPASRISEPAPEGLTSS